MVKGNNYNMVNNDIIKEDNNSKDYANVEHNS